VPFCRIAAPVVQRVEVLQANGRPGPIAELASPSFARPGGSTAKVAPLSVEYTTERLDAPSTTFSWVGKETNESAAVLPPYLHLAVGQYTGIGTGVDQEMVVGGVARLVTTMLPITDSIIVALCIPVVVGILFQHQLFGTTSCLASFPPPDHSEWRSLQQVEGGA
jgi:hypothetical protein